MLPDSLVADATMMAMTRGFPALKSRAKFNAPLTWRA
jgi:hypothetical protein